LDTFSGGNCGDDIRAKAVTALIPAGMKVIPEEHEITAMFWRQTDFSVADIRR
jgi:hypothetical protein